jgi:hypothetical protein
VKSLDQLTVDDFAPTLGEAYELDLDGAAKLELVLVDARGMRERAALTDQQDVAPDPRDPFIVVFRGPVDPILPQRIYRLEHSTLGVLEIFLVPIGRDADGVRYEAVFG